MAAKRQKPTKCPKALQPIHVIDDQFDLTRKVWLRAPELSEVKVARHARAGVWPLDRPRPRSQAEPLAP